MGSKGKKSNPLILDEFQWDSEWVDANCEPVHHGGGAADADAITWAHVDEATGASQALRGRNLPRAAVAAPNYGGRKGPAVAVDEQDIDIAEEPIDDDLMEEDQDGGGPAAAGAIRSTSASGQSEDGMQPPGFQLDDALFDG
ncbi:hypothetical protein PR202_gb16629 [Eleusine coracana subsp. coracana]|uniref:Uncharacterized protein n=1 Tax=Eleusine coracana subsp. coracana TaxID=191504 RepID=A0AAV5F0X4_ELECO|nr:hypothetical protein PR202_gb16629 [Eleusine coracana subsp. coracana]